MNVVYNRFLYLFFAQQLDLVADTFKVALMQSSYVPDASHLYFADVAEYEVVGGGYTAGGAAMSSITVQQDAETGAVYATSDPVSWENSSLSTKFAVIYRDSGDAATSDLVACFDFDGIMQSLNGTFTVTWPEGIMQLAQCAV